MSLVGNSLSAMADNLLQHRGIVVSVLVLLSTVLIFVLFRVRLPMRLTGGRRPSFRQQACFHRNGLFLQMGEDFFNRHWVFDAGNEPDRITAFPAGRNVDVA